MIYPAVVMKVIGFPDKDGNLFTEAIQGRNTIKCLLDNGELIDVDLYGNDRELNSLRDYINSKAEKNIKENKKKAIMSDIAFDEQGRFLDRIEQIKKEFNLSGPKAQQEAIEKVALEYMLNSAKIKQASIIRMALAEGNNGYNSKSIISVVKDGEKNYSQTGIYQHALNLNSIPIEIQRVINGEGEVYSFYQVRTSKLINTDQINMLLDHSIRTIEKTISKPFIPKFIFSPDIPADLKTLFVKFNSYSKKGVTINGNEALNLLKEIRDLIIANKYHKYIQISLPMLIDDKIVINAIHTVDEKKGKSPFQIMRDAIINLNFSSENPDVKEKLKTDILNLFLKPMLIGESNPRLLLTYNIVAPNIFGESDSWGYMTNNVDFSKLTLEINEQKRIINYLEKECGRQ